jgi:eukaryotic-like serine/threonine-protein kinase
LLICRVSRAARPRARGGPLGQWFTFTSDTATRRHDIIGIAAEETWKARPVIASRFDERSPAFSPDGRWIAYVADDVGRDEVHVQPFPGPGARTQVSIGGGTEPVWSRGGRELYFRQQNRMLGVTTGLPGSFRPSRPQVLFTGSFDEWPQRPAYDVTPDGQFLMVEQPAERPITHLRVVLNWFDELKRQMGTR